VVLFQILLDSAEPRGDDLVVFSSLLEGRLTGSSWHLRCHPCDDAHNIPKQGKSARLDYSSELGLLR